jgi:hypothetical protein
VIYSPLFPTTYIGARGQCQTATLPRRRAVPRRLRGCEAGSEPCAGVRPWHSVAPKLTIPRAPIFRSRPSDAAHRRQSAGRRQRAYTREQGRSRDRTVTCLRSPSRAAFGGEDFLGQVPWGVTLWRARTKRGRGANGYGLAVLEAKAGATGHFCAPGAAGEREADPAAQAEARESKPPGVDEEPMLVDGRRAR